jgi:hypothetical protein
MTIASQKVPDVAALATQKKFHTALNRSIATWKLENEGGKNKLGLDPLLSKTTRNARPVLAHPTSPHTVKARVGRLPQPEGTMFSKT